MRIDLLPGCGSGGGAEALGFIIVVIMVLGAILLLAGLMAVVGGVIMGCSRRGRLGERPSTAYRVGRR